MAASSLHSFTSSSLYSSTKTKFHHRSSSYKPLKITVIQKTSILVTINSDVDAHIEHALSGRTPACVYEPMHHLIFRTPRSLAPALCIAACEAVGGQKEQAIGAASALHLMRAAAFAHENLFSSNKPKPETIPHASFGANIHLLSGDGILPLGYELLTRVDDPVKHNSGHILKVIMEISRAMGPQGMVEGQYEETKSTVPDNKKFEVGRMDNVCKKKEGGMYACAAACGAILGGVSDEEVEALRRYGLYVGLIRGMHMYETGREEIIRELRWLALGELEPLQLENVEAINNLMDQMLSPIAPNFAINNLMAHSV